MNARTIRTCLAALLAIFAAASGPVVLVHAEEAPTVIYLVRHAEKMDAGTASDPKNPPLTDGGVRRANALVPLLADAEVTGIYSTDYLRTRQTVQPLADELDIEMETYDPARLAEFARELRTRPGRFVVSGHSNTTPALVELLGGDPGAPIDEPREYDRLYVLVIDGDSTTTVLLRYGEPSLY